MSRGDIIWDFIKWRLAMFIALSILLGFLIGIWVGDIYGQEKELKCIIFNDGTTAVVKVLDLHQTTALQYVEFCDGHGETISFFIKHGYVINATNYWEVILTR